MSLLTIFYYDWIEHPNYWFQKSDKIDTYLKYHYECLIDLKWDDTNLDIYYHLAHIIIHDQLIRHIERNCDSQHIIQYHLEKAVSIHEHIRVFYDVEKEFSCKEWCFWGLPIRHYENVPKIMNLLTKSWKKLQLEKIKQMDTTYLKKFIQATYQRMPISKMGYLLKYTTALDLISFTDLERYKSILDYFPETTPENIKESTLNDSIKHFINNHLIGDTIILSISGGVDSMLCSYILKQLNVNVVGLHINYCNRGDSESEFVQHWCDYLGIPLYVRNFKEIQRQPCMENEMRSIYESYTRDIRYESYRDVWNKTELNSRTDSTVIPYVILGHNLDDCFENILTNVCHQHKYDNLKGMKEHQVVEGICFLRPLLTFSTFFNLFNVLLSFSIFC